MTASLTVILPEEMSHMRLLSYSKVELLREICADKFLISLDLYD